ncbi:hypothetical protein K492DRAFT_128383 [Lichtheimia hyalospora FSU 10163]|nr:hypothetical protein K492DRAFT_128383 [Lichtheimia hyalospora FSU 10163]
MTHGLQMSKLFSKSFYDATKATDPFWLKGSQVPEDGDITLVTAVTPGTWNELERLAGYWKGPISAVLHASKDDDDMTTLATLRESYNRNQDVASWVDIHLVRHAGPPISVLLPRNAERNLARLLARTEYVVELSSHIVPATNVRRTFNTNRKIFEALLKGGDMLVVPTFGFPDHDMSQYTIPYHKSRLLELVDEQQMGLTDRHWDMNEGPTNLVRWRDSTTLYSVENYHYDYEPIVVESKRVQPWCTERFLDRRSACFLSSYLAGGEFWVLPDDFMIRLPESKEYIMPDLDHVVENRLYAKFYWEQCVHHARQLDALGLWKGPRSEHVRKQCSRVIQNWGKGLIGRPE